MIDKQSKTWREVAAWAQDGLAKACDRIESLGVAPDETNNLRGRIATLRELLALQDAPGQRVVKTGEDYGFQGVEEG